MLTIQLLLAPIEPLRIGTCTPHFKGTQHSKGFTVTYKGNCVFLPGNVSLQENLTILLREDNGLLSGGFVG
jgi:hypothetical protein